MGAGGQGGEHHAELALAFSVGDQFSASGESGSPLARKARIFVGIAICLTLFGTFVAWRFVVDDATRELPEMRAMISLIQSESRLPASRLTTMPKPEGSDVSAEFKAADPEVLRSAVQRVADSRGYILSASSTPTRIVWCRPGDATGNLERILVMAKNDDGVIHITASAANRALFSLNRCAK